MAELGGRRQVLRYTGTLTRGSGGCSVPAGAQPGFSAAPTNPPLRGRLGGERPRAQRSFKAPSPSSRNNERLSASDAFAASLGKSGLFTANFQPQQKLLGEQQMAADDSPKRQ